MIFWSNRARLGFSPVVQPREITRNTNDRELFAAPLKVLV